MISRELEDVWRRESPYVLGALLRRHGDLGDCEDAAQEALVAAAEQWARDGVPEYPRGWLIRVASRRLIDLTRSNLARSAREAAVPWRSPAMRTLRRESISMKPVRPTTVCCCFCCAAIRR